jgi:ABC-2 type transport system permease protein
LWLAQIACHSAKGNHNSKIAEGETTPGSAPGFVEELAPYLPTGGAARLMWAAVGDFPFDLSSTVALVGWTVVLAGVAVWAYRRDEGRRFS